MRAKNRFGPWKDSFQIQGSFEKHICLVPEPLREPLWHLGSVGLPPNVLKAFLRLLLKGLEFLQSECHVIHTDLISDNFLIVFEDPVTLENYIRDQETNSSPYKMSTGRPIFELRPDFGPLKKGVGQVKTSDFSAAVFGNGPVPHSPDIQPQ